MKIKNSTSKSLAAYSVFAVSFIAYSTPVDAQIIYQDIDPDQTYGTNGDLFQLDFDLNGNIDIELRKVFLTSFNSSISTAAGNTFPGIVQYNHIYATPYLSNAFAGSFGVYGFSYPYVMNAGDTISMNRNWLSGASQSIVYSLLYKLEISPGVYSNVNYLSDGLWFGGKADKYLGVRFDIGGYNHYGWIRLTVDTDNVNFTIKDYAYNSNVEELIIAGYPIDTLNDTTNIFVSPALLKNINAYSFNNLLTISVNDLSLLNSQINIYSESGTRIYEGILNRSTETIKLVNASTGIYILKVINDSGLFTKKFYLQQNQ